MADVSALHLLLCGVKLQRPHEDLFHPLDVVFRRSRGRFPGADVAPVCVCPPSIVEAAVQEPELCRLGLHELLEREASAPGQGNKL